MNEADLTALNVGDFLDRLASGEPTPGGGSAAALAGALAASLVCMVCNLTLGRQQFAEVEPAVRSILERAEAAGERLRAGVQGDAAAYGEVVAARRLPRGTDAEQALRCEAIQAATKEAALAPLAVAEACAVVLQLCEQALAVANPNVTSDITVAALLARAALEGAAANVEVNLASLDDERLVAESRRRLAGARAGGSIGGGFPVRSDHQVTSGDQ